MKKMATGVGRGSNGFVRAFISVLFMLWIGASVAGSQTQQPKQSEMAVKIDTDLVVTDAQVVGKKTGRVIGDLKPEDFLLYEDGVRQEIAYFSQEKLPLSIVLLLDVSGSVSGLIKQIQAGALQALQRLKPEDEVAVMVFTAKTQLLQDFT